MRTKSAFGFATGDLVTADVPAGAKAGRHVGRVAIRRTGSFNVRTASSLIQGISHRHCRTIQRGDGYEYTSSPKTEERRAFLPALKDRVSCAEI